MLAVAAGLLVGAAKEALDAAGVRALSSPVYRVFFVSAAQRPCLQLWPTGGAPSFRDFVADAAGSLAAAALIAVRTAAPGAKPLSVAGTPLQEV